MSLTKASLTNLYTNEKVDCLFNPTEYTIQKTNNWQSKPVVGRNVPKMDFTGGGARTLTVELLFDVYEDPAGDVRTHIDKLNKLTLVEPSKKNTKTEKARPPFVLFEWGQNWHFKAAVTQMSVRFTLFRSNGVPVRAMVNLSLQEAEDETEKPGTNPTSHAEPGLRRRLVKPRDSLALIAFQEFGDSSRWRAIADANGIEDPLDLSPGQVLAIPRIR